MQRCYSADGPNSIQTAPRAIRPGASPDRRKETHARDRQTRSPSPELEQQMKVRMSIQIRCLTVLLTLSFLTSPARPQQRPAEPAALQVEELTLEQAVALALQENRQVKVAQLELDKFSDRLA